MEERAVFAVPMRQLLRQLRVADCLRKLRRFHEFVLSVKRYLNVYVKCQNTAQIAALTATLEPPFTYKVMKPLAILNSYIRIPLLQLMHCLKFVWP
jgi:hypothetical protein